MTNEGKDQVAGLIIRIEFIYYLAINLLLAIKSLMFKKTAVNPMYLD